MKSLQDVNTDAMFTVDVEPRKPKESFEPVYGWVNDRRLTYLEFEFVTSKPENVKI